MSNGIALLISWLRWSKEPLPEKYRARGRAALAQLRQTITDYLQPATSEAVIRSIDLLATTFQVSLPDEDGQMVYAAVLSEVSAPVLKNAVIKICKTHTYKTLPLPAEILKAAEEEMWQWRALGRIVDQCIATLNALD